MQDEKLRIALDALLELKKLVGSDAESYGYHARRIVAEALRDIQREHYLGSRSPVVHELLAGVKL